eukprot:TRINITY_DN7499_c0_g1_i1.p1 TRINITY_DN7499_c0_g1~~TRINITY_DN7499_c0_g1_i1.p1  ORF type:complete len:385 (+),score=61.66 TRINITY_DN7499_c0_g1_i1:52-1155(+)
MAAQPAEPLPITSMSEQSQSAESELRRVIVSLAAQKEADAPAQAILEVREDNISALRAELGSLLDRPLFVVTLLGSTGSGKSSVIRAIFRRLQGDISEDRLPLVMPRSLEANSTSMDVSYWIAPKLIPHCTILFLDMEGENGTSEPTMMKKVWQLGGAFTTFANTFMQFKELGVDRGKSVSELLPELAYCLSNVVVHVSTSALQDQSAKERCFLLATAATRNVFQVVAKPALIIINNQFPDYDLLPETKGTQLLQDMTDIYFADVDGKARFHSLKQFFREVKCVILPLLPRRKNTDAQKCYDEVCASLTDCITAMCRSTSTVVRMTATEWLALFKIITQRVSKRQAVPLHNLLVQMRAVDNEITTKR